MTAQEQQLKRLLGRGFATAACVGTIIGLLVGLLDLNSAAYGLGLAALSVPVFLWLKARRGIAASFRTA